MIDISLTEDEFRELWASWVSLQVSYKMMILPGDSWNAAQESLLQKLKTRKRIEDARNNANSNHLT